MGYFTDDITVKAYKYAYKKNYDHSYPNENIVRISEGIKLRPGSKCLDFGYSFGENLIHYAKKGHKMFGIDIDKTLEKRTLKKIKERNLKLKFEPELKTMVNNAKKLPYKDNTFDFILANQNVYLLASEEKIFKLLKEFKRVAKKNAELVITMMGEENWVARDGKYIGNNCYKLDPQSKLNKVKGNFLHRYYILNTKPQIEYLFRDFKINEIGHFDNSYLGVHGHHYVLFLKNTK